MLLEYLRENVKTPIHFKYAVKIIVSAIHLLKFKPNINLVSTAACHKVTGKSVVRPTKSQESQW